MRGEGHLGWGEGRGHPHLVHTLHRRSLSGTSHRDQPAYWDPTAGTHLCVLRHDLKRVLGTGSLHQRGEAAHLRDGVNQASTLGNGHYRYMPSPPAIHSIYPLHYLLLFPGSLLHIGHLLGAGVRRGGAAHEARVHLEGADEAPVEEAGDDVAQVNGVACRWPYGVDKCEPQSQDWRQGMMWRR